MVDFILPGVGLTNSLYRVNMLISQMKIDMPEYFIQNRNISGIYGNLSPSKWAKYNTLYKNTDKRMGPETLVQIKRQLQQRNLYLILDVSNPYLKEKNMFDYYDNVVLDIFNSNGNFVSVSSDLVKDYISKNYKNYKIIADEVSSRIGIPLNHDGICYDVIYASEVPELCEGSATTNIIIPDSICYSCEMCGRHMKADCLANLAFYNYEELRIEYQDTHFSRTSCKNIDKQIIYNRVKLDGFLSNLKIDEYAKLGLSTFKLEYHPFYTLSDYIDILTYYLVKTEFKDVVKTSLLHLEEKEILL